VGRWGLGSRVGGQVRVGVGVGMLSSAGWVWRGALCLSGLWGLIVVAGTYPGNPACHTSAVPILVWHPTASWRQGGTEALWRMAYCCFVSLGWLDQPPNC
jgi:hypothetical protein